MGYDIEYAAICSKGKVRDKNQDNLWCMGAFLDSANNGLIKPISSMANAKSLPAFAVFDGMGGEQHGEMAAHIAADAFNTAYNNSPKKDIESFLLETCMKMNGEICQYAETNNIRSTGTTAAIVMFGKNDIYICNVGDSRVYQHTDKHLTQISRDHCAHGVVNRKAPLTQNLGIPVTEFLIEPYLARGFYEDGDKYLICSDGLTDLVSEPDIAAIIEKNSDVTECAKALIQKALDMGGSDNITVILCDIHRRSLLFNKNRIIKKREEQVNGN